MTRLSAGMGTSHVPGLGAAIDNSITDEPYWQPVFEGLVPLRAWHEKNVPDVVIIVYNDHATSFSLDRYANVRLIMACFGCLVTGVFGIWCRLFNRILDDEC